MHLVSQSVAAEVVQAAVTVAVVVVDVPADHAVKVPALVDATKAQWSHD